MSNLGSFGSSDYQNPDPLNNQQSPILGATDPHAQTEAEVRQLFMSANPQDHTLAMKMLLAMMSKGYDASEFSAFVVQMVASQDTIARQLAYVFLNHYAEESPETAILSINTFQRSLTDSDPIIRALAIKVMSSIRSKEILPAIQNAISQVKAFKQEADITGIVLTKLDGTAKGGVVIGIVEENQIPVKFIGVGEQIDDMEIFNSEDFVKAII